MNAVVRRFAVVVAALVVPLAAGAQERVAQLSKVAGKVTITRAVGGKVDTAVQAGPRVRNGSISGRDVVATDAGAEATILFADGSEVRLKPKTTLTIQETDVTGLVKAGKQEKPVGRKIRVMAGNIWTNVVPNPQVATEFETPSGVAAVKGTIVTMQVDEDGASSVATEKGVIEYENRELGVAVTVEAGFSAGFTRPRRGVTRLRFPCTNPGVARLRLVNGERLTAGACADLSGAVANFGVRLTVDGGSLSRADGSSLPVGGGLGFVNPVFPKEENVTTTIATTEGAVEFRSDAHQLRMTLREGASGGLQRRPDGSLGVKVGGGNKTPVPVEIGDRKVEVKPGSEVNAGSNRGGAMEISVERGEAVVTDSTGNQQTLGAGESSGGGSGSGGTAQASTGGGTTGGGKTSSGTGDAKTETPIQKDCGECGVPDGTGGCVYVDALCPDAACRKGRKCQQGSCSEGIPVASQEDPNCG